MSFVCRGDGLILCPHLKKQLCYQFSICLVLGAFYYIKGSLILNELSLWIKDAEQVNMDLSLYRIPK